MGETENESMVKTQRHHQLQKLTLGQRMTLDLGLRQSQEQTEVTRSSKTESGAMNEP